MAESMQSKLQKKEQLGRNLITLGVVGGAAATVIYFWSLVLPFLIDVATNTLKLAGLCAVLGFIGYCVMDKRIRTLALYMYRSATRWFVNQFVNIDPIGVLNTYVSRLKDRLDEMDKSIGSLKGQRDQLRETIEKNEQERIHNLKLAQQAQKHPEMRAEIALRGRQAGRLGDSNITLKKLLTKIEALYDGLVKMRGAADVTIQDIQSEVDVRTRERKALMSGYNAFMKAQKIMKSNDEEREIYDMTLEKLANDYAERMGEIETFMDLSKSIVNGIDLDNGIYEEDALAQLDAWEKKDKVRVSTTSPKIVDGTRVDVEEKGPDSFSELFDDKPQNKAQR